MFCKRPFLREGFLLLLKLLCEGLEFAALRIEPNNPQLWYRLALLRLQQGKLDLAKSLAAKSSALAQGDEDLQVKNRTIMEQVELLQGVR